MVAVKSYQAEAFLKAVERVPRWHGAWLRRTRGRSCGSTMRTWTTIRTGSPSSC
jgi:hypothetical protein